MISVGANGLANPRDFLTPVAWYDEIAAAKSSVSFEIVLKFQGSLFTAQQVTMLYLLWLKEIFPKKKKRFLKRVLFKKKAQFQYY